MMFAKESENENVFFQIYFIRVKWQSINHRIHIAHSLYSSNCYTHCMIEASQKGQDLFLNRQYLCVSVVFF